MAREQAEHFCPLKPKAGGRHALDGCVQIGVGAGPESSPCRPSPKIVRFQPDLIGFSLGGALVNLQSNLLGAGEGDEARFGIFDDGVCQKSLRNRGKSLTTPGAGPRFLQEMNEEGRDGGSVAGGL